VPNLIVAVPAGIKGIVRSVVPAQLYPLPNQPLRSPRCPHRADKIVALVPIEEDRGSGRRTLVYVDALPEPLVAGRTEGTILRDMVGVESGSVELLRELQLQIGQVRPLLKSSIRSEAGLDLDRLSQRISDLTGER
jgi:hypothetical protein